jgi:glycosyltransferase involved in cell wall biosynthesis
VITTVAILVPASNEQARLDACLRSLAAARGHVRRSAGYDVGVRLVVVLDACTDDTELVARSHRGTEIVSCHLRQVGGARAIGAAHILSTSAEPSSGLWLANTDADSRVPVDWLTTMLDEAARGAHLVLGTVLPDIGLDATTERRWLHRHVLRENHPHIHGANFGIRADAYRALGGWPGIASGEDVALAQRAASAAQLRIVRTARIPVRTSPRLIGRAPRGFSSYLRGLTLEDAGAT